MPSGPRNGRRPRWDASSAASSRYAAEWNGKVYATKQVRPIFVDEADVIVVVTVYVYYFDEVIQP